ncbi:hypothetical protein V6N13_014876 [Hibiscus sabdariffa]
MPVHPFPSLAKLEMEVVGLLRLAGMRRCQGGQRRPQVEATDALVIQLTPCCQSVLAVMLAKAGVSVGFTYYWI